MNYTKQHGFGFWKCLLLIVIILTFVIYQSSLSSINEIPDQVKTAQSLIKDHLASVETFYMKNQQWPLTIKQLIPDYTDETKLCSPWEDSEQKNKDCYTQHAFRISCGKDNTHCDEVKQHNNFWGIKLKVPNQQIAEQVVDGLPSAQIEGKLDDLSVAAYITIPDQLIQQKALHLYQSKAIKKGFVAGAGIVTASAQVGQGQKIYLPNCPCGFEGHYMQFIANQRTGMNQSAPIAGYPGMVQQAFQKGHYAIQFTTEGHINGVQAIQEPKSKAPYIKAYHRTYMENGFLADNIPGMKNNYYLTFCLPTGSWHIAESINDAEKIRYQQDPSQTQDAWEAYHNHNGICS